jgi:hypothetical protein
MLPGKLDPAGADGRVLIHPRQVLHTTWADGTPRTNSVSIHGENLAFGSSPDSGMPCLAFRLALYLVCSPLAGGTLRVPGPRYPQRNLD